MTDALPDSQDPAVTNERESPTPNQQAVRGDELTGSEPDVDMSLEGGDPLADDPTQALRHIPDPSDDEVTSDPA